MPALSPSIAILGIRGIPAAHGGFETFAQRLALHLADQGWRVTVYCQTGGKGPITEDDWQGIQRVLIPSGGEGTAASIIFDWRAIGEAIRRRTDVTLTLGYNTAIFCARLRLAGVPNLINMDGIEWARQKWGAAARTWFYLNDWAGCWLGNHLIADHPSIANLLSTRTRQSKITVIPYGADEVETASAEPLAEMGLEPGRFATLIARPEPENSILEIVRGFSARRRNMKLAVLGRYNPAAVRYHADVQAAASDEVIFYGAIHDKPVIDSLRSHCALYMHGHRVGGTNPSLVEALGAGNAVVAHNNRFNRWVAQDAAIYFWSAEDFERRIDELLADPERLNQLRQAARRRHAARFTWLDSLSTYDRLLRDFLPQSSRREFALSR